METASSGVFLTGSQDQHFAVRMAIVAHMLNIASLLESCHNVNVDGNVLNYIFASDMDTVGWGTETEMYAFAHLMKCNNYSYNPTSKHWMTIFPAVLDSGLSDDVQQKSLYIVYGQIMTISM